MAKPLTKTEIVKALAEKVGVTKKQASAFLDELAQLVYKHAKDTFTLPGIGKIVVANRPARVVTMQIGPRKGEKVKIPAKRVLKFRFAKVAKENILGASKKK